MVQNEYPPQYCVQIVCSEFIAAWSSAVLCSSIATTAFQFSCSSHYTVDTHHFILCKCYRAAADNVRGGLNFQHLHYITIAVCCHFFPFIITISIYITFSVTFSMYFHYDRGHFFLVLKLVSKQSNMPLQFVTWSYDVLMCVCETRAGGQAYINISAAFSVCYYYRDH